MDQKTEATEAPESAVDSSGEAGREDSGKTWGYLRVSTIDQDNDKFRADVLQFAMDQGFGRVEFVAEKVSGKKPWRERKLAEIVNNLQPGDRLIVPELSRLGRSMIELLEIMKITKERGARIYAVRGNWALDDSISGKILGYILSMMAEVERDFISERTSEALRERQRIVKAGGSWTSRAGRECRQLGRPAGPGKSKLDQHAEEIESLLANGATKVWIAKKYNTTPQNLANWLKKNKAEE